MQKLPEQSPFDTIRRTAADGHEYWQARDLMPLLGYKRWERFAGAIDRAKVACGNAGSAVTEHFFAEARKSQTKAAEDYRLTRYACYLIAMNGDPRKKAIAAAQSYFAHKAREAEVVVPALNEQLEALKMQLEIERLRTQRTEVNSAALTMHGPAWLALHGAAVAEIEKPVIEVIDDRHNVKFEGQTLVQAKDYLRQVKGLKLKSGADVKRALESLNLGHLIAQTPRSILSDYIPTEHLEEVYRVLGGGDRQMLLGEGS